MPAVDDVIPVAYSNSMSGFTKLFSSLIHSTVWREPMHVKVVWITMLAMSDQHGMVLASLPGLADAARVTLEECENALLRLSSPDKYSRTKEHEGRRVVAVDGGWFLYTYAKHRRTRDLENRRQQVREAVRRHRSKPTSGNQSNHRKPRKAQAEAEAEAETTKGSAPRSWQDPAIVFGWVLSLITEHQQPGGPVHRVIAKRSVEALGSDALGAYEAVGGAERFCASTGETVGFLRRDFIASLVAIRAEESE